MQQGARPRLGQVHDLWRVCTRHASQSRQRGPPTAGFQGPEGHGENIWVFAHRRTDQIIYSFKETLDGFHGMKQLPFNGKKTKPAKLRKDYWAPLARMQFQPGQGAIGRSVFQKLRELKHLHEVAWADDFRLKTPREFTAEDKKKIKERRDEGAEYRPVRSKEDRGAALNAQKDNSIADMAAVLAGEGQGNRVVVGGGGDDAGEGKKQLAEVVISWANDRDRHVAEAWSDNVTHALFERPSYTVGSVEVTKPE
ncbi:Uncharacterized protein ESCO_001185 [Escovopsis weberi]|uniref:Large ribosomal subunit protein mL67 n=1 Tax=Escovopsis weberi TaxID=150374 RepID=A0A0M8N478_ESCWE|nr:Uncharacterized protein ESCO_001185 [Escovopsis weberi]